MLLFFSRGDGGIGFINPGGTPVRAARAAKLPEVGGIVA
jgi:hypothetical protein